MQVDECSSGWVTPDGRSLLYYRRISGMDFRLDQHDFGSSCSSVVADNHPLGACLAREESTAGPTASGACSGGLGRQCLGLSWAPLPISWSGMYALTEVACNRRCQPSRECSGCQDSQAGGQMVSGAPGSPCRGRKPGTDAAPTQGLTHINLRWSLRGKQLAVIAACGSHAVDQILVLLF